MELSVTGVYDTPGVAYGKKEKYSVKQRSQEKVTRVL